MATQAEQFAAEHAAGNKIENITNFDAAFEHSGGYREQREDNVIYVFSDASSIKRSASTIEVGLFVDMIG